MAIAQAQKDKEIDTARIKKRERTSKRYHATRTSVEIGYSQVCFRSRRKKLLGKDKAQRELMTKVMLTTFPPEYSAELIDKLEAVTNSPEVKQELQSVRRTILPKIIEKRDVEQLVAKDALNRNRGLPRWATELINRGEYRPPYSIPTKAPDSCRCPQPFEGGIDCWGWDDMAICEVINGKCVTRCFRPR